MIHRAGHAGALASGVQGVQRAQARFNQAAGQVTSSAAKLGQADRVSISKEAAQLASSAPASSAKTDAVLARSEDSAPEGDLVEGLVGQMTAKAALKANVATLRTADEMTETLVDLARRR